MLHVGRQPVTAVMVLTRRIANAMCRVVMSIRTSPTIHFVRPHDAGYRSGRLRALADENVTPTDLQDAALLARRGRWISRSIMMPAGTPFI
jgi:hypothetical protein